MERRAFLQLLQTGSVACLASPAFAFSNDDTTLSKHRIKDIKFTDVQLKWPRFVGKNARRDVHGYGPKVSVCKIFTDQGASGWGMTRGNKKTLEEAATWLMNKSLSETFSIATGITASQALPFDIALHDLAGVVLDKPVYELMGRKRPLTTKCYSGMIYFDELEKGNSLETILEECRNDYALGYRQFKLKIGRGKQWMPKAEGIKRDIEVTKLVAKNFPDCEILVDGNDGFTVDELTQYLEGIQPIPLFWIEEPFAETVEDYQKLRNWITQHKIKTLLADGEYEPDQALLLNLENKKLIDVHLSDIIGYGFTPWRKLMPELEKRKIWASPHAFGELLKTYYIAHLTGAYGNTVTIEGVPCTSEDIDFGNYPIKNGRIIPSPDAGFGMTLLKKV